MLGGTGLARRSLTNPTRLSLLVSRLVQALEMEEEEAQYTTIEYQTTIMRGGPPSRPHSTPPTPQERPHVDTAHREGRTRVVPYVATKCGVRVQRAGSQRPFFGTQRRNH